MKKHEFIYDLIVGSNNEIRLGKPKPVSQNNIKSGELKIIDVIIQENKLKIILYETE